MNIQNTEIDSIPKTSYTEFVNRILENVKENINNHFTTDCFDFEIKKNTFQFYNPIKINWMMFNENTNIQMNLEIIDDLVVIFRNEEDQESLVEIEITYMFINEIYKFLDIEQEIH